MPRRSAGSAASASGTQNQAQRRTGVIVRLDLPDIQVLGAGCIPEPLALPQSRA